MRSMRSVRKDPLYKTKERDAKQSVEKTLYIKQKKEKQCDL